MQSTSPQNAILIVRNQPKGQNRKAGTVAEQEFAAGARHSGLGLQGTERYGSYVPALVNKFLYN